MLNLKGFIVGNGATDWNYDVSPSFPEVAKFFNLIPESVFFNLTDYGCELFFNGTMKYDHEMGNGTECDEIWGQINSLTEKLNWYDLYRKNFNLGLSQKTHDIWGRPLEDPLVGKDFLEDGRETTYKRGFSFTDYVGRWLKNNPAIIASQQGKIEDKNILGDAVSDYFNNQAIKDILNINPDLYYNKDTTWVQCNNKINRNWHL